MTIYEQSKSKSQERIDEVINFISNNLGATKTEVINHLDNHDLASKDTTRNVIDSLIQDNILYIEKDKPNSQTQHLYINKDDEFNKISELIEELENIINKKEFEEFKSQLDPIFTNALEEFFMKIVYWLISRIGSSNIRDEKSKSLYSRIINLMKSMTPPVEDIHIESEIEKFQNKINAPTGLRNDKEGVSKKLKKIQLLAQKISLLGNS